MAGSEHFDVLVVGAGISGIDLACHLQTRCPDRSFVLLEGRAGIGGTWDLFRYPGVRSDSDMYTLGYAFKPWTGSKAIAEGPAILEYLHETVAEHSIEPQIRFRHRATQAQWSSETATWTVRALREDTGESVAFTCSFLALCSGYYSYAAGYTPEFKERGRFRGPIVHPQQWPADLDYRDKRVVIIGSGATAVTLLPALSRDAAHVTMLQRSPSYVVSMPDRDVVANLLQKVLPSKLAYWIARRKNARWAEFIYRRARRAPQQFRAELLRRVRAELGPDYDVDTHFAPRYRPWDQRLCLVPNSDLFRALRSGKGEVVTDQIDCFTERGIQLVSGRELEADIIVTATGLQLVAGGDIDFALDGAPLDFAKTWTYKGFAFSDVPNLVSCFGYINASWTLRVDLICGAVCRILNHMRETGTDQCTPRLRPSDLDMAPRPFIDDFSSGYIQRMLPRLPRQGDRAPWINSQSYARERKLIGSSPVDDGVMQFTRAGSLEQRPGPAL